MCGRYSLSSGEFSEIQLAFQIEVGSEARSRLRPRYNIAPTFAPGYEPPIIFTNAAGRRELGFGRWWLIPSSWKRPLKALPTAFNARAEELGAKPFWSRSFESRRCLVPTSGWREFRGPSGQRSAFQFHYGQELFAFAGLWERWLSPDGADVRSFAIVTVAANDIVRPIHDRMPLCVAPASYERWLDPGVAGADALASLQLPEPGLAYYEADAKGNDVRLEGPECIAPARISQLGLFNH
jgi:putative SOS response-associated peptidase YedK